ncbi:MAG TPA: hypothetical protein VG779_03670 [Actinomycetota bacterium]|jgi:uncharacterized protein (DUF302 family)|nr:hypothetical protein [Actinomycetota bacterium]
MDEYGLGVITALGFDQAVSTTRLLLKAQGFRILSEMPAPAALAGSPGRQHLFMGVWQRLINATNLGGPGLDVGDHLACNVAVFDDGGQTMVAVLDPTEGLEGWAAAGLAEEAKAALEVVLAGLASPMA